jgi:hypothetical protein
MRPELHGAIAQGDEQAEPKVDGGGADRSQTEIGAEVEDADGKGQGGFTGSRGGR